MKTLVISLAILTCSLATTLLAKDGAFVSKIISDGGGELRITLSSHEWLKITNFTQIPTDGNQPEPAGVAVFNGVDGIWAMFATDPRAHLPHEDLFVGGPAVVVISPPQSGATVFVTYQRGSD